MVGIQDNTGLTDRCSGWCRNVFTFMLSWGEIPPTDYLALHFHFYSKNMTLMETC